MRFAYIKLAMHTLYALVLRVRMSASQAHKAKGLCIYCILYDSAYSYYLTAYNFWFARDAPLLWWDNKVVRCSQQSTSRAGGRIILVLG